MEDIHDTLMSYGCIAVHAGNPDKLVEFLNRECGTRLQVAWPENARLQLRPRNLMGHFSSKYYDVCLDGKYMCCGETMEPFGVLELPKLAPYQIILMIGRSGGIYCYEDVEKCVYCLAEDMKTFMKLGCRRCEYLQAEEAYQSSLIEYDDIMKRLLITFNWDDNQLHNIVTNNSNVYEIHDPTGDNIDTHFVLWCSDSSVPLKDTCCSVMRGEGHRCFEIMVRVVSRMVCMHQLFGALGCLLETGEFLVRIYVIQDKFGVLYGFDPAMNGLYRLAENMKMFTCMMGRKSYRNYRYDLKRTGIARLEKVPWCCHTGEPADPMSMFQEDNDPQPPEKTPDETCRRIYQAIKSDVQYHVDIMMLNLPFSQRIWPQQLEALAESCLLSASSVYDVDDVKAKLLGSVANMRAFEMHYNGANDDSDREDDTVHGYLFDDNVCRRCVSSRRLFLFRVGRGIRREARARVSYV
ncbi:Ba61/Ba60 [Baboon cytomegalovirus]|nr:Ba61/Ba60 [Baboon cytomegalovirus]